MAVGKLIKKLFVYDHCPYCVKARMIFGLKGEPLELTLLLNDDEETPRSLIGKKMVPILEKSPGQFMPESMDIVQFIDEQSPPVIVSKEEDSGLLGILDQAVESYYSLTMPRWVSSGMEEFKTSSAVEYFRNKKEAMIGSFEEALKNTSVFKEEIKKVLSQLEGQLSSEKRWYKGDEISFNDFHLFAFLRGLSIVKGLNFPPLLEKYAKYVSEQSKVPLNHSMAI